MLVKAEIIEIIFLLKKKKSYFSHLLQFPF